MLLIVDDEKELLSSLKEMLSPDFEKIETALTVQEAIAKTKTISFEAVLSDYKMPVENGIDFLKQLRSQGNQVPFIMMTGFADKQLIIEALRLGAYDFVEKPWEFEQLRQTILGAVELGRTLKRLGITCGEAELIKEFVGDLDGGRNGRLNKILSNIVQELYRK